MRAHPIGHDGPVLGDEFDEFDNVAAPDVVDGAAAPPWKHDVVEHVDGLPPRVRASFAPGVKFDELRRQALHRIAIARGRSSGGGRLGFEFEGAGIAALRQLMQRIGGGLPRPASVVTPSNLSFAVRLSGGGRR